MTKKTDDRSRVTLRLPATLHADLIRRAEDEGVSLNTLIIYLLGRGIDTPRQAGGKINKN